MFKTHLNATCLLLSGILATSSTLHAHDNHVPRQACWPDAELVAKADEGNISKKRFVAPLPRPASANISSRSQNVSGAIRSVRLPPGQKLVALTFDLCEGSNEVAGYQGEIVDILRASGVKATFFMGGKWMMTHQERAQQLMADARFEVGNHTWEHRNLRLLSSAAAADEIRNAEQAYDHLRQDLEARKCVAPGHAGMTGEIAPKTMSLFRFPFGACDPKSLSTVGHLGLTPIQWDVSSDDPDYKLHPNEISRNVLDNVRPGSIVLFHANGRGWYTDDALPAIISGLKSQGYEFVTVTELLKAGDPVVSSSCYDRTVGDTDQYDELARQLEAQ